MLTIDEADYYTSTCLSYYDARTLLSPVIDIDFYQGYHEVSKRTKDDIMHKAPTRWGLGRIDVCSLTPSGEAVSRI